MDLVTILKNARTIAIFGASPKGYSYSNRIAHYLQDAGYRIIPVNPYHEALFGETCYPDLLSIPADIELDIVDVFRRPQFTADAVQQVIDRAEQTGNRPVIWTQIGVSSPEARKLAEDAGLTYIANACTMATHAYSLA